MPKVICLSVALAIAALSGWVVVDAVIRYQNARVERTIELRQIDADCKRYLQYFKP